MAPKNHKADCRHLQFAQRPKIELIKIEERLYLQRALVMVSKLPWLYWLKMAIPACIDISYYKIIAFQEPIECAVLQHPVCLPKSFNCFERNCNCWKKFCFDKGFRLIQRNQSGTGTGSQKSLKIIIGSMIVYYVYQKLFN